MSVASSREAISSLNPVLRALRLPDRAERKGVSGPLRDFAVSIKDVIDVAGWRVACNHRPFADRRPTRDAELVARLRRAGAWLAGGSATLEFAYGSFSPGALYEPARNPWNPARSPGGSSAGAGAAAAAGLCDAAVATDTSGSVRGPAALCGVLGLKLTHGAVPMAGIHPLSPSLDSIGVLARELDPLSRVVATLLGKPGFDARPPRRIGWLRDFDEAAGISEDVAAALREAFAALEWLGIEVRPMSLGLDLQTYHAACIVILLYEAWQIHAPRLRSARDGFAPDSWARLALGAALSAEDYHAALTMRRQLRSDLCAAFEAVDLLVLAGAPAAAPPMTGAPLFTMLARPFLTAPASLTGAPALSLPIGFDPEGMPLAMQAIGPHGGEGRLIALAHRYRERTAWHLRWPPLARAAAPTRKSPEPGFPGTRRIPSAGPGHF